MKILHKGLRALRERDDRARLRAQLVPRLRPILFRLQEATHPRRADAPGFQRRARSRQGEGPGPGVFRRAAQARLPALHLRQRFQTYEFHDLDEQETVSCSLPELRGHVEEFGFILGVQCRTPNNVAGVFGPPPPTANTRRHFPVKPISYPIDHAHRASSIR